MSKKTLFDLADNTPANAWKEHALHFQTPPAVAAYMVSLVLPGAKRILEPTPGQGVLVTALINRGFEEVTAPHDFFKLPGGRWDACVLNPPFSAKFANLENAPPSVNNNGMRLGYYIFETCLELADQTIALMPWFTLTDSDVRTRKLKRYGLRSITALPRSTFDYSRIQTMILDLQRGYKGSTEFKVF